MPTAPRSATRLAVLCTLLLARSSAASQETSFEGRVEVLRGRAVLYDEDGSRRLLGTMEKMRAPVKAHLELGAGAELRLSWPGLASMRVWGPASLDWQPWMPAAAAADREPGLAWRVGELAWADLEVRRGVHRLELPGDWSARLEQSAIHFRSLPWGPIEVRHHAGQVLQMLWSGDPHHVRPPLTIYPGSSLRLDQPPEGAEDVTRHARAWDLPTWPWSRRTDNTQQALERPDLAQRAELQRRGPEAWPVSDLRRERASEFQEQRNLYTEVLGEDPERDPRAAGPFDAIDHGSEEPLPPSTDPQAGNGAGRPSTAPPTADARGRSSLAPQQSRPTRVAPPPADDPPRVPAERTVPREDSPRWRGLELGQRTRAGELWVQKASGVEVRAASGGRWKVLVDSGASSGIWCMGPAHDWFLSPGSIAVFGADGNLQTSYGKVERQELPAER